MAGAAAGSDLFSFCYLFFPLLGWLSLPFCFFLRGPEGGFWPCIALACVSPCVRSHCYTHPDLLLSFVGFAHAGKKKLFLAPLLPIPHRIERPSNRFSPAMRAVIPRCRATGLRTCEVSARTVHRVEGETRGVRVCRMHVAEARGTRLPALEVSSNLRHALCLAPAIVTALQPNLGWCATGRYGCDTPSQRLRNGGFLILRLAAAGFSFLGPVCNGLGFDTTKKHQKTIQSGWGSGTNSLVVCRDTRCALG